MMVSYVDDLRTCLSQLHIALSRRACRLFTQRLPAHLFVLLHVAYRLVASRMQTLQATVACWLRPRLSLLRLEHDDLGSCQTCPQA
jgi:hypothetical protein